MLSITTDFTTGTGCPEPELRKIADAGYSHIHWCHQWNTDFLYSDAEIAQIDTWMREFGLQMTDLHASQGVEKRWNSPLEYERIAGVDLVKNRIAMTARLGADVIIMHTGEPDDAEAGPDRFWNQLYRSLDELEPFARVHGVRIAVENGVFATLRQVLDRYDPDYVGLCYDCGHGNMSGDGLDETEALKDRLISVHLHDNHGDRDEHNLLFSGTVDWERLAGIMARSAYTKPVSMELSIRNSGYEDVAAFLAKGFETGSRFAEMVDARRSA
ncbi:MAG: sugar phosphate isomerase/epimerase [bacterium]|nr:sugar phosphate isomerase/epimerase [bacterium]